MLFPFLRQCLCGLSILRQIICLRHIARTPVIGLTLAIVHTIQVRAVVHIQRLRGCLLHLCMGEGQRPQLHARLRHQVAALLLAQQREQIQVPPGRSEQRWGM